MPSSNFRMLNETGIDEKGLAAPLVELSGRRDVFCQDWQAGISLWVAKREVLRPNEQDEAFRVTLRRYV